MRERGRGRVCGDARAHVCSSKTTALHDDVLRRSCQATVPVHARWPAPSFMPRLHGRPGLEATGAGRAGLLDCSFVCLRGRRSFCLPHLHGALPLPFRSFSCAINRTHSPAWSKQSRPSSGCSTRPPHLPCGTLAMVTPRPAPEPPAEPSLALRWARVGLEGALSRGQWIDRIHCCGEGLSCVRRTPMEPFAWFGVMRRRGLGQANRLCRAPGQLCGRVPVCVHPCI